jgi:hypothetical protein
VRFIFVDFTTPVCDTRNARSAGSECITSAHAPTPHPHNHPWPLAGWVSRDGRGVLRRAQSCTDTHHDAATDRHVRSERALLVDIVALDSLLRCLEAQTHVLVPAQRLQRTAKVSPSAKATERVLPGQPAAAALEPASAPAPTDCGAAAGAACPAKATTPSFRSTHGAAAAVRSATAVARADCVPPGAERGRGAGATARCDGVGSAWGWRGRPDVPFPSWRP